MDPGNPMNDISDEEIAQMHWCDLYLREVSWIEGGRDLVLKFLVPPADRELRLTCRWTMGLRISLDLAGVGGAAMTRDGTVLRNPEGAWDVGFDFASAGEILLICQDLELSGDDGAAAGA